jgi:hypothetical protein
MTAEEALAEALNLPETLHGIPYARYTKPARNGFSSQGGGRGLYRSAVHN